MVINSIRQVIRGHDELQIYLTMADWPTNIPLPPKTTLWQFGDGPSRPYWKFVLEPERTIEVIVGIFNMPLPAAEVVTWYQTEMGQQGWQETHHRPDYPTQAHVGYQHPTEARKFTLHIIGHAKPICSYVILTYVVDHPWDNVDLATEG